MTRSRLLGIAALLIAAPLAIVAAFLVLYTETYELRAGEGSRSYEYTSWVVTAVGSPEGTIVGGYPLVGVPVVVAASLLVLGAVRAGALWARLTALGGAALLLGSAWTTGHHVLAAFGDETPVANLDVELGPAMPLFGVACVLALAGALLVQQWPARAAEPDVAVVHRVDGADDDTPPFGIPVVDPAADEPHVR
ncbi:hypothetical protein [Saccharothrix obliqua]|uniref:hypothetical protein n=1 Tax=Saccharothrix obliqua TaxID=2861747 RepID=UPI001C5D982D|nr:hypothetical protein [Saccharothrix obliqua]MBW4721167.1 hypothetical protein [Saccharothrix obliqua]